MMNKNITLTSKIEEHIEHLYNIIGATARLRKQPKDYIIDHNIWYCSVAKLNVKTGATSVAAMRTDDNLCTDDHIYAPQMFAPYVFNNIRDISFNQFRSIVIECGSTIQVTKEENNILRGQTNILLKDKYKEAGIKLLWTDGLVYDDLPFEISERFQMMEQYYYDMTYEDPFDKL